MSSAAKPMVTLHVVASLDGFIARKDNSISWMDSPGDVYEKGVADGHGAEEVLQAIDCYVLGSHTYEHALELGWPYGDTPTVVVTSRELPSTRKSVEFYSGDLARLVNEHLRPRFNGIWFVGGAMLAAECMRLGLADELRYSVLPILIGNGIRFFERLDGDIALHLMEATAYRSGMVELRYEVRATSE